MRNRLGLTAALRRVSSWTIPVGLYSVVALARPYPPFSYVPALPTGLEAAMFFAMSVLLAFRTNRAYERWWEARTLWGTLVNVSRNLAVKSRQLADPDAADRQRMRDLMVAFCYGLKNHLRDENELTRLPGISEQQPRPQHIPSWIAGQVYGLLRKWRDAGRIRVEELWLLDAEARTLLDVCGACERIKTTLPSISWRWFVRHLMIAFLLLMPWGLVEDFGYWTIPMSMAIAYFVFGCEGISRFVEEPFGHHEDHLDLDAICRTIEKSVSEILE